MTGRMTRAWIILDEDDEFREPGRGKIQLAKPASWVSKELVIPIVYMELENEQEDFK